jgi:glycosyltransferase involved in cell wall biosynthesis
MRILHVLGKLDRGGVETWLVQLLEHVDRSRYQMDFVVHTTNPGAYDEQIRSLGAKIIPCLHTDRPIEYARHFREILSVHGPYDCIHSHVHHYSGYVLLLARMYGVPIRIAHSHTADPEEGAGSVRRAYLGFMRKLIAWNATAGITVSELAGDSLFPSWRNDPRWLLVPYGIDIERFRNPGDSATMLAALGIPPAAKVVGHVGRFVDVKNHQKILEIAKELCAADPNVHFLLLGDGPLRPKIEAEIASSGLGSRFTLTGNRPDVPQVLQSAMDAFLFPSKYEGLPIALMEAQLAGLSCVASDAITPESALNPLLVHWMSLSAPASAWADSLRKILASAEKPAVEPAVRKRLSIESCVCNLTQLYDSHLAECSTAGKLLLAQ